MNFINEIRAHLANYETTAASEIHKFIDYLESKYKAPAPAVVQPPVVSMPFPASPAQTVTIPVCVPATTVVTLSDNSKPVCAPSVPETTCAPSINTKVNVS
jgi:hypothetical protein